MLIKAVNAKGIAIPYSAEESLKFAIQYGVKTLNGADFTFWAGTQPIVTEKFRAQNSQTTGTWEEAFATGYVYIGKTDNKTDRFKQEKKFHFDIHYKLDKDEIGAPDLKVLKFNITPIETNPAMNVGEVNIVRNDTLNLIGGEMVPQKTENADAIKAAAKKDKSK